MHVTPKEALDLPFTITDVREGKWEGRREGEMEGERKEEGKERVKRWKSVSYKATLIYTLSPLLHSHVYLLLSTAP